MDIRFVGFDHKIHLKLVAVNVAQNVHKPSFDASLVHAAYYVEDAEGFARSHGVVQSLADCGLCRDAPMCTHTKAESKR